MTEEGGREMMGGEGRGRENKSKGGREEITKGKDRE